MRLEQIIMTEDQRILGKGSYSTVRTTDDPNVVKKVNHDDSIGEDPFDVFADFVKENPSLADNPFLPRIIDTRYTRDKAGNRTREYYIERLYPLNSVTTEEVTSSIISTLSDPNRFGGADARVLVEKYCNLIEDAVHQGPVLYREFSNPALISAIKAIDECVSIAQKRGLSAKADIKPENLMVRRVDASIQLVFSDPIG